MRVLIVDDSRAMRMIVKRAMRRAGYKDHETVEANNGVEALEIMDSSGVPDVVLCDWNMPEMTGIALLQEVNERGYKPELFGFITSEGTPMMREKAREAGANFLLGKPFTPEALRMLLDPVLG
ncbi:MAG: response regulator [Myxococcota bacterium]